MTLKSVSTATGALLASFVAAAHVPYIEGKDYPTDAEFRVENIIQSKAFYAYLEESEVDEFVMQIEEPTPIYINMLIPFCKEYATYANAYALIGPGLPQPVMDLPVDLQKGYGAIVWNPVYDDWSERPFMYEYFSDRQYFEGIRHRFNATEPGEYRLIVWHPQGKPGDYIAIIGRTEDFSVSDMRLAYTNTPIIRNHEEMQSECTYEGDFSKWFDATD